MDESKTDRARPDEERRDERPSARSDEHRDRVPDRAARPERDQREDLPESFSGNTDRSRER